MREAIEVYKLIIILVCMYLSIHPVTLKECRHTIKNMRLFSKYTQYKQISRVFKMVKSTIAIQVQQTPVVKWWSYSQIVRIVKDD